MTRHWPLLLALGGAFLCAAGIALAPVGRAAEPEREPPSPRTHQLMVCKPGERCEPRGGLYGGPTCELNASSERLTRDLPKATRIECRQVRR